LIDWEREIEREMILISHHRTMKSKYYWDLVKHFLSRQHVDVPDALKGGDVSSHMFPDNALVRIRMMANLEYQAAMRELHSLSLETLKLDFAEEKFSLRFREIIQSVCAIVARRFTLVLPLSSLALCPPLSPSLSLPLSLPFLSPAIFLFFLL
jgi:hypothetical protein